MSDEMSDEMIVSDEQIAARAGLPIETVQKVSNAHTDFLFALGLASPDDDKRGEAMRQKYPDLLRESVTSTAGDTLITYELEAMVVQLESGESAEVVTRILAANYEQLGTGDRDQYQAWAKEWCAKN